MKEMKDNTHFQDIRELMMVSLQYFVKYIHNVLTHIISANKLISYYSMRLEQIVSYSLELKTGVPQYVVPKILELQSGVR